MLGRKLGPILWQFAPWRRFDRDDIAAFLDLLPSEADGVKLRDAIASSEFDTVIGKVRFKNGENVATPGVVSQWQSGEFEVVWPPDRATAPAMRFSSV